MTSFKLMQQIGEGSYSRVYKAVSQKSSRILAVKVINFKQAPQDYIQLRQLKILKSCKHPNIAPILDFIKTQQAIYIVFDYFPMNLNQYYRYHHDITKQQLSQRQIQKIMLQICLGVAYLHSKGIMHRDIKPQNVMVDPATLSIKLIDFGLAKSFKQNPHTEYIVTRWYRPLQIVLGMQYDQKIDIFGVAAVYLQLLKGQQIFQSQSNMDQLYILLRICGYPTKGTKTHQALQKMGIVDCSKQSQLSKLLNKVNGPLKDILTKMLDNCPQRRPSIMRLLTFLQASNEQKPKNKSQLKTRARSVANGLTLVSLRCKSKGKPVKDRLQNTNCIQQKSQSFLKGQGGFCQLIG